MNWIITIIAVLLISFLFTSLAKKIKVSTVVALIAAGLVVNIYFIRNAILEPNTKLIFVLGDIALLSLMFLAGLKSSWKVIYNEGKEAILVTIFAALIPFLLGFVVFFLLGFSVLTSMIIGTCLTMTAEGTTAQILLELRKLNTRVGATIIDAGLFDDILGLSLFIWVTYIFGEIYLKEYLLLAGAIIAFFIGVLAKKYLKQKITEVLEIALVSVIIPFFFISLSIHFNLSSLIPTPLLSITIIVVAIFGKLIGTFLVKPFCKFTWKQLYLIGWAMNSRGAVALALAVIALRSGLVSIELYSSLIVMALVTTLIFPFIITWMIKRNTGIMS